MRTLIGFVLGVIVTVFGAYLYDSATGRMGNGLAATAAAGAAPLVNWNVVSTHWDHFQIKVRDAAVNIEQSVRRHTG